MANDGGGAAGAGGGGSSGGGTGGGGAAPPARGRMGDLSMPEGGGAPVAQPAQGLRQRTGPMRQGGPLPGDEGVMTPEQEAAELAAETGELQQPTLDGDGDGTQVEGGEEVPIDGDEQQLDGADDGPIFGVSPEELIAMLRQGQLPKDMIDAINALPFTLTVDGQQVSMTIPEMKQAAMMRLDYSRKTRELAQVRQQAEGIIQRDQQQRKAWTEDKTGSALHDDLMAMGCGYDVVTQTGPLYEIARFIAAQQREYNSLTPEGKEAYVAERRAAERVAELERKAKELETRERTQHMRELQQKHGQDLQRMVPVAFQKLQIKDSKLAQRLFRDHIRDVVAGVRDFREVTQPMVDEAARLTRESLLELGRYDKPTPPKPGQRPQQPQQRRPGGELPVTAVGGTRPAQSPANGMAKRGRLGDLSALNSRR